MVSAPSLSDLLSSYRADRSKSVTLPMPSQRGHMPPRRVKVAFSAWVRPAPRSTVMAPLAVTEGTLTEYALGGPICGCPSRLNRIRSMALASVTVPTVERALAPIRSWSTMIAVVSPSSTSTSGRASVGMKPCTKALYVSLISRCDSAAMVLNTSELLPEPETPVNTVSRRLGSSTLTSLRLFTRAPCTRIRSWRSATGSALLIGSPSVPVLTRLLVCHHPVDLEVHPRRGVAVGAALPRAATAPRLGLDGDRHRGARHVRAGDRGPDLAVDPVHQPALGPLQLGGVPAGPVAPDLPVHVGVGRPVVQGRRGHHPVPAVVLEDVDLRRPVVVARPQLQRVRDPPATVHLEPDLVEPVRLAEHLRVGHPAADVDVAVGGRCPPGADGQEPARRADMPGVEPAARVPPGLPVVHAPLVGPVAGEVVGEGLGPAGQG